MRELQLRADGSPGARPRGEAGRRTASAQEVALRGAAERGVASGGTPLPYAAEIQRAFGHHDVSRVEAHAGPAAAEAASELGAEAYATGDHVAFGGRPDLFTAAHEAAHVVQQRGGARGGDAHERHADAVAAAVVAGRSAEGLLDRSAPRTARAAPTGAAVQRITARELQRLGRRIARLAPHMPERGINLWVAKNATLRAEIHLLGTSHGLRLSQMGGADQDVRAALVRYLQSYPFTHVYSETPVADTQVTVNDDLAARLEEGLAAQRAVTAAAMGPRREQLRAHGRLTNASTMLGGVDSVALDDAYVHVAQSQPSGAPKASRPTVGALETPETRAAAALQNTTDLGITSDNPDSAFRIARRPDEPVGSDATTIQGNQRALFGEVAAELAQGRDIASSEQRNSQWIARLGSSGGLRRDDKQLWIVGAAHLPGLIVRLVDLGWTCAHQGILDGRLPGVEPEREGIDL